MSTVSLEERARGESGAGGLADTLLDLLVPWTAAELDAAKHPWPHAFMERQTGLFPVGEVSVLASAGREGKTTVVVSIAAAIAIEASLGGMSPLPGRSVVIYSAEDDRSQYARKVGALARVLPEIRVDRMLARVIVPNLDDAGAHAARTLVAVLEGHPVSTVTVEAIIDAVGALEAQVGLLVFETASTLSEADETNPGFRTLVLSMKRIARELQVPVLLTHHVSQASLASLPDLAVATTDIRGATALVNNARQTAMLVNLGMDSDPHPDGDARSVLRRMVAPGIPDRVTALITLDSSKSMVPPPLFFTWSQTEWGPAAVPLDLPGHLAGRSWRKLREMVLAERSNQRQDAKDGAQSASVTKVVQLVAQLQKAGRQSTARAVSIAAGKSPGWAKPYLDAACDAGELTVGAEKVERTKGKTDVYRATYSSEGATCIDK